MEEMKAMVKDQLEKTKKRDDRRADNYIADRKDEREQWRERDRQQRNQNKGSLLRR